MAVNNKILTEHLLSIKKSGSKQDIIVSQWLTTLLYHGQHEQVGEIASCIIYNKCMVFALLPGAVYLMAHNYYTVLGGMKALICILQNLSHTVSGFYFILFFTLSLSACARNSVCSCLPCPSLFTHTVILPSL